MQMFPQLNWSAINTEFIDDSKKNSNFVLITLRSLFGVNRTNLNCPRQPFK